MTRLTRLWAAFVAPGYSSLEVLTYLVVYYIMKSIMPTDATFADVISWRGLIAIVVAIAIWVPCVILNVRGQSKFWVLQSNESHKGLWDRAWDLGYGMGRSRGLAEGRGLVFRAGPGPKPGPAS